ncbi:SPX and EXS domain-containing protein 1-like [Spodoptera litura]|uniref:SPX and EXS domain-containing protein 1-like n=1 Tax=Spodoptera litura TaxID=69820 RepID=A0A9J7IIH6_SPOLT|nr:SPX and EXS domain-containing protein 1-like [Spodoptera litura]
MMGGTDILRVAVIATLIAWCTAYPHRGLYGNNNYNNNDANLDYAYRNSLSNGLNNNNLRSNLNNLNNLSRRQAAAALGSAPIRPPTADELKYLPIVHSRQFDEIDASHIPIGGRRS